MPQELSVTQVGEMLPEITDIGDAALRTQVAEIWIEVAAEMAWSDLRDVPKNPKAEPNRTLIGHVRGVTQIAVQICEVAKNLHGTPYDRDLLLAACLLHDVSKPVEYEPDPTQPNRTRPGAARKSKLGNSLQHAAYGVHKILARHLSLELANLVLTHTHASNMRGKTWEAAALFYADFSDTDAGRIEAGAPLYIQRWRDTGR